MTRRSTLFGLVRLPWDPLLLAAVALVGFTEWRLPLLGDRTVTEHGVVVLRERTIPFSDELVARVKVALFALAIVWLPLALARRSRARNEGRPTRRGGVLGLLDRPLHRDPVVWLYGVVTAFFLQSLALLTSESGGGSDDHYETTVTQQGSVHGILMVPVILLFPALVLAVLRLVYRWLGGERPWRTARSAGVPSA